MRQCVHSNETGWYSKASAATNDSLSFLCPPDAGLAAGRDAAFASAHAVARCGTPSGGDATTACGVHLKHDGSGCGRCPSSGGRKQNGTAIGKSDGEPSGL